MVFGTCSAAGVGTLIYALENSLTADAFDLIVHPVKLPWSHSGLCDSLDIASYGSFICSIFSFIISG